MLVNASGELLFSDYYGNRVRRLSAGRLVTVAGTGAGAFSGDGGAATAASLRQPAGIALDAEGNLLIMDSGNQRVRRVNRTSGVISTVAGGGQRGFCGDNGPAAGACFRNAFGLAVTSGGEILIADRDNFRIRRVNGQGTITTAAGNGLLLQSQDGVQAVAALLGEPRGLAMDANGNVLVADNRNGLIRRVAPNGVITTVAGSGAREDNGDGGPAKAAGLAGPLGVAVDAAGNIFVADADNNRVKRIGTDGIINTVAGTGQAGFSGDGGPATQARLNGPSAVAIDRSNNIYITELENGRLRQVTPNGQIRTLAASLNQPAGVAVDAAGNVLYSECGAGRIMRLNPVTNAQTRVAGGGSVSGPNADNGPATNARLGCPVGVTVDVAGAIYFTDYGQGVVRRVDPSGILTTIAGNGRRGFSGDGGPAAAASFNLPWGVAVDSNGTVFIGDSGNNRVRALLGTAVAPTFSTSSNQLTFTAMADGVRSEPAAVQLTTNLPGLGFTINTCNEGWLRTETTVGSMPARAEFRVDPTGLSVGQYQCAVTIAAPGANPPARVVMAQLAVRPKQDAKLTVDDESIHVSYAKGAPAETRQMSVRNTGGGNMAFSAEAKIVNGSDWLAVTPTTAEATPNEPGLLDLTIDVSALEAGTYNGSVAVARADGAESVSIPVYVSVSQNEGKMLLSQSGLTFTAPVQGGAPLAQSVSVLNQGKGTLNWTARVTTLAGGDWLRVSSTSGSATAGSDAAPFRVSIDPAAISTPDTYYGQIRIDSPNSGNSPQFLTVIYNALEADANVSPEILPTALVFTGEAGVSPGAQVLEIANVGSRPVDYRVTRASDGGWLDSVPASATLDAAQQGRIVVQPDFTNLAAGTYRSKLNVSLGGISKAVDVVAYVNEPAGSTNERAATDCNALDVAFVQPANALSVAVGQAAALSVRVTSLCGVPFTGPGAVKALFSNGEPEVVLDHVGGGVWTKSWTPRRTSSSVTVQVNVTRSGSFGVPAIALRNLSVVPEGNTPRVVPGAVVNAASFARQVPVAPGSFIAIGGERLANEESSTAAPLPTDLNGTEVLLGDQSLPLQFVSNGQLNVQVPFGLTVNTQLDLVVRRGNALSNPEKITVAEAQPAIFTQNQAGTGAAFVFNSDDFSDASLITAAQPAKAGDVVRILCTGLGELTTPVPAGSTTPEPVPTVQLAEVLIGGIPAEVQFSGLRPNSVGQYVVVAVVPAGVSGAETSLQIRVAGQESPVVTMAIQ
jgi:uncharacterized protein (TIGR03437 family)